MRTSREIITGIVNLNLRDYCIRGDFIIHYRRRHIADTGTQTRKHNVPAQPHPTIDNHNICYSDSHKHPDSTNLLPPPLDGFHTWCRLVISLVILAEKQQTTIQALLAGNCLVSDLLIPGTVLYLPGSIPTRTPVPLTHPQQYPVLHPEDGYYILSNQMTPCLH